MKHEDPEEMAGVMNYCFQSIFTKECDFQCQTPVELIDGAQEIQVSVEEVRKTMEEQNVKKTSVPEKVSNWIIKKCSDQLANKIHNTTVSSLIEGKY